MGTLADVVKDEIAALPHLQVCELASTRKSARPLQVPPTSNTGGLVSEAYTTMVMVNGKVKEVLLKKGSSGVGFIDTLTISMSEDVFVRPDQLGTDEEIACNVSSDLAEIMGFGLFSQQNGRNGYAISYKMGNEQDNYGFFAQGGRQQRGTVCLFFTGVGLTAALSGWENRLYDFLSTRAPHAKITRIDLAHDFFDGEYTPDQALTDWQAGLYTARHTKPIAECVGGDWLHYRGTGKTFYVGSRKNSSRFCRIYEKGKQLGDCGSPWVRVEVEMHNRDIVIPHDILLYPGTYMVSVYPVFENLFTVYTEPPKKCDRVKKVRDVTVDHVLKYASMQCAPSIVLMKRMGYSADDIVDELLSGKTAMPKRLSDAAFDCAYLVSKGIHELGRPDLSLDTIIDRLGADLGHKPKMQHRSYEQYVALKRNKVLNSLAFGSLIDYNLGSRSFHDFVYDRNSTPSYILNPRFKD